MDLSLGHALKGSGPNKRSRFVREGCLVLLACAVVVCVRWYVLPPSFPPSLFPSLPSSLPLALFRSLALFCTRAHNTSCVRCPCSFLLCTIALNPSLLGVQSTRFFWPVSITFTRYSTVTGKLPSLLFFNLTVIGKFTSRFFLTVPQARVSAINGLGKSAPSSPMTVVTHPGPD